MVVSPRGGENHGTAGKISYDGQRDGVCGVLGENARGERGSGREQTSGGGAKEKTYDRSESLLLLVRRNFGGRRLRCLYTLIFEDWIAEDGLRRGMKGGNPEIGRLSSIMIQKWSSGHLHLIYIVFRDWKGGNQ